MSFPYLKPESRMPVLSSTSWFAPHFFLWRSAAWEEVLIKVGVANPDVCARSLYPAIVSGLMFFAGFWVSFGSLARTGDLNETLDSID